MYDDMGMRTRRMTRFIAFLPLILFGIAVFTALGGWVVMRLWNWLLPPMFGWPALTFWKALGMLALCRLLFGGLGIHSRGRQYARRRLWERWESMSPDEREHMRGSWHRRGSGMPEGGGTSL